MSYDMAELPDTTFPPTCTFAPQFINKQKQQTKHENPFKISNPGVRNGRYFIRDRSFFYCEGV
jgi:hypothetical protein